MRTDERKSEIIKFNVHADNCLQNQTTNSNSRTSLVNRSSLESLSQLAHWQRTPSIDKKTCNHMEESQMVLESRLSSKIKSCSPITFTRLWSNHKVSTFLMFDFYWTYSKRCRNYDIEKSLVS